MAEKIKRSLIAHFLDTSDSTTTTNALDVSGEVKAIPSAAVWKRVGTNVTDMSIDFGAQTETEQDIVSNSATTDVTGYQPTSAVSQQCSKGDDIFEYITELRRSRAILADAHTFMLNVDLWDSTTSSSSTTYAAEVQEVSIQLDSYGGAGGETPTQEFTINFIGDPVAGTVTVSGGVPTFTATSPVTG